jgi:ribosomal protein L6P/L9E
MFGTARQHINNIMIGLSDGFSQELIIHGIGFEVIVLYGCCFSQHEM